MHRHFCLPPFPGFKRRVCPCLKAKKHTPVTQMAQDLTGKHRMQTCMKSGTDWVKGVTRTLRTTDHAPSWPRWERGVSSGHALGSRGDRHPHGVHVSAHATLAAKAVPGTAARQLDSVGARANSLLYAAAWKPRVPGRPLHLDGSAHLWGGGSALPLPLRARHAALRLLHEQAEQKTLPQQLRRS